MLILRFFTAWVGIVMGLAGIVAVIAAIYLKADIRAGIAFLVVGWMLSLAVRR